MENICEICGTEIDENETSCYDCSNEKYASIISNTVGSPDKSWNLSKKELDKR